MIKFDVRKDDSQLVDVTLKNGVWVGCIGQAENGKWGFYQEMGDVMLTADNLREIAGKVDELNGVQVNTAELVN